MSMIANLTLAGLVDYRPDVFDELELPTPPTVAADIGLNVDQLRAAWTIDTDDFINFLCFRTMSMSLAIPDADFFKKAVGVWSRAHLPEWQRMFDTMFYKYNPLYNKDYTISETESGTNARTENESSNSGITGNNTITGFTHGYDGGQTHTDDGLTWTHADKTKGNSKTNTTGQRANQVSGTDSKQRVVTEKGNIGVTMVQDMIEKEREMALFNVEEFIADEFTKNFMLMIW